MIARLLVLILLAASTLVLGTSSGAANAEEVDYLLTVQDIQPAIPAADDDLTVTAVLRNNSEQPLTRVTALLRVGGPVLTSEVDVANVAAGGFRPRLPIVRYSETAPVPPDEQRTFTMQIPMAELALSTPGAYPMAVEAVDVAAGTVAYTPTVLPWMPPDSWAQSIDVTWLWPLTSAPARAPDGLITDPGLAGQFGSTGRMNALLEAGRPFVSQVSWVLDPQTQQTAEVLASPHQVLGARDTEDRPADAAARQWLTRLNETLSARGADVSAMGYAYPDSTSLVGAGLSGDVVLATTTAADQVSAQVNRSVRSGFSWAPDGAIDQQTMNVLRAAGVILVALDARFVDTDRSGALVTLTTDSGPITGLRGNSTLRQAINYLSDPTAGATAGRQLFLAATAVAALNEPGGSMAVLPPPNWGPPATGLGSTLSAATSAPWLRLIPLAELLTTPADERPTANLVVGENGGEPSVAQPAGLSEQQTFGIGLANYAVSVQGQVTTQPSPALQTFREAVLRSGSTWWHRLPEQGVAQLSQTLAQINEEQGKLTINTAGTITFPGDEGRVPITISNDLDVPAEVGLQLVSDPSYLLRSEAVSDLTIPAGQRVSLEVPVTVVGSQSVTVAAQLLTPQGMNYGPAEEFQLRSTAYSRLAQWVIIGALVLLALLVVRSVTTRIRAARAKDEP